MTTTVWIVGQWKPDRWDFGGVFDTQELAEAACQDQTYFVGPAPMNVAIPHERQDWPGCYYPKAKR